MSSIKKTKQQLADELQQMQQRVAALEALVDEHRQAEEVSKKEMQTARRYLRVAGVMFVVINRNKRITLINQKGCDILGYTEEEIIGKNWFNNFLPKNIRTETKVVFDQLMAGQTENVEYYENAVLTKSNQERIVAWHNIIIRDEDGNPTGTLSSGTDITAQFQAQEELRGYKEHLEEVVNKRTVQLRTINKQLLEEIQEHKLTESALLESQVRFAGILDIANEAIISLDNKQQIMLFNKGAERTFGYTASEAIGQSLAILLPKRFVTSHRHRVAEFEQVPEPARLMGERGEIFGRRKNGQEFPAMASISKLEIGDKNIFTVVLRDITERKQMEREREQRIVELKALNEAIRPISAELSLEQVLQKVTHAAQKLIRVEYVALGLHDGEGRLSRFITVGIDPADHEKIGPLPAGRGLLGHLLKHGESLVVADISGHASAVGFPENHPHMKNLLGVPLFSKGEFFGALYLTNKTGGTEFTEADRQLVEMLAAHAAIAIENAQLYEQTQRLAILEERQRFARDLHDGIIQSIYAVGLALDQAKLDIRPTNLAAQDQIELSLKSLASVIKDIRNYIFDLRPAALKYKGLKTRLEGLIKELRVNTLLPIYVEVAPDIDSHLTEVQARHIFHIIHEALSNAARHAKANQISVKLIRHNSKIKVEIEDDGVGFEWHPRAAPGHHGLVNIQTRAAQLNATLNIDSAVNHGTRLVMVLRSSKHPASNT